MNKLIPYIVLIAIVVAGTTELSQLFLGTLVGWTTLSLSQSTFTSNANYFNNEKMWVLTVAQGGMGQYATGLIDNEVVSDKSGTKPANDLSLKITYSDQSCEYAIKPNSAEQPIYRWNVKSEWSCVVAPSSCGSECLFCGKYSGLFTCFCVESIKQTGAIAYLESPYVKTTSTIEATAAGKVETRVFDTKSNISGYLGSNVYVNWNGYLVRDACPSQEPYYAFYSSGDYKLGTRSLYEDYKSDYISVKNSLISACFGWTTLDCTEGKIDMWVSSVNNYATSAMDPTTFGTIYSPQSMESSYVKKDLQSAVNVPIWTFYVKAAWLGIYQPVPKADITSATGGSFKSGSTGNIYATIKNVGDDGNINVYVTCESPFSQVGGTQTINLNAGESKTIYIPIQASASERTSKVCVIHAEALGVEDTMSVTVTVDPQQVCEPNKLVCDMNKIMKCNSAGSAWVLVEDCGSLKECQYSSTGIPSCIAKPVVPKCEWWDIPCLMSDIWSTFLNGLKNFIIAFIIAAIILFLLPFVPFLATVPFIALLRKPKYLLLVAIAVALVIVFIFMIPVADIVSQGGFP